MSTPSLTPEQLLALLAGAPPRLAALTAGLGPAQLRTPSGPDEWSIHDVLAHLRSCADMWGGAIAAILAEDHPTIRAVNPRTWIKQTNYPNQAFRPSLGAFTTQRAELLALLEPLPPRAWSRLATVTGAGKPLQLTLHAYAERLALHERPHLKQIERLANALRHTASPLSRRDGRRPGRG